MFAVAAEEEYFKALAGLDLPQEVTLFSNVLIVAKHNSGCRRKLCVGVAFLIETAQATRTAACLRRMLKLCRVWRVPCAPLDVTPILGKWG